MEEKSVIKKDVVDNSPDYFMFWSCSILSIFCLCCGIWSFFFTETKVYENLIFIIMTIILGYLATSTGYTLHKTNQNPPPKNGETLDEWILTKCKSGWYTLGDLAHYINHDKSRKKYNISSKIGMFKFSTSHKGRDITYKEFLKTRTQLSEEAFVELRVNRIFHFKCITSKKTQKTLLSSPIEVLEELKIISADLFKTV